VFIENVVNARRQTASNVFEFDETYEIELAGRSYDRCYCPEGRKRQLAAILAAPDRTENLMGVKVPTLVVHGTSDHLVDVSGGEAIANLINDSQFLKIEDMGHELPKEIWPQVAEAIAVNARRV